MSDHRPAAADRPDPAVPEREPMGLDIGEERWEVDAGFLAGNWTCIWGRGCRGIGDEADTTHLLGCCSLGAEFADPDDAANAAEHAGCLEPELWQYHAEAERRGIFADPERTATRVVEGACIFLNRAGFEGGPGCALHIGATSFGDSPIEWKPAVCWQLPLGIEERMEDGRSVTVLRRWERSDFGVGDEWPKWFCTDTPDAYVGGRRVIDSLAEELAELMGDAAVAEIRARLDIRGE